LSADAVLCPDCQSPRTRELGSLPAVAVFAGQRLPQPLPGGRLLLCRRCDLRFRFPAQDLARYETLYDNTLTGVWQLGALRKDQALVQAHVNGDTRVTSVLDFGCYTGQLLAHLRPGLQRFGIEVNAAAAAVAARQAGAQVWRSLGELPAGLCFDTVVAMDVIEHFASPRALMQQLLARLKPGGTLLVTTGDGRAWLWRLLGARWWYCYFPEHIAFISRRWLAHHVVPAGAELVQCLSFNYLGPEPGTFKRRWTEFLKLALRPAKHERKRQRRLRETGEDTGTPGIGLSADHLFVVLRKRGA
jgi:SAM-dependent methyltransferase